jgi:hypothetical protein
VLDCFGNEFTKFSISRYLWDKIFQASEDVVKHYPHAPYIMHIIEHVLGIHFPTNAPHKALKLSNKLFLQAKRELEEAAKGKGKVKGKGALGSTSHSSPPRGSRSRCAHSEEPVSSSFDGKTPSKFKFFMEYMFGACCVSAERVQEMLVRMHRIEQKLDIHSSLLHALEPLRDPFEFYDEACKEYYGESSDQPCRCGKQQVDVDDEEYREEDDDNDDDGSDRDDDEDYEDE